MENLEDKHVWLFGFLHEKGKRLVMNLQTSLRKLWGVKNHLAYQLKRYVFLHSSRKSQFTSIFNSGGFGASPSLSGAGSDMAQTQVVRSELPKLIKKYAITSMLDVPCGDWYWMQHIDLTGVDYTGADIVDGLISADNNRFGGKQIKFVVLDMVQDDLPMVDLIFCRDCLIHLTLEDGRKAIQHFKDSGSKWLLTTTYTSIELYINHDTKTNLPASNKPR